MSTGDFFSTVIVPLLVLVTRGVIVMALAWYEVGLGVGLGVRTA